MSTNYPPYSPMAYHRDLCRDASEVRDLSHLVRQNPSHWGGGPAYKSMVDRLEDLPVAMPRSGVVLTGMALRFGAEIALSGQGRTKTYTSETNYGFLHRSQPILVPLFMTHDIRIDREGKSLDDALIGIARLSYAPLNTGLYAEMILDREWTQFDEFWAEFRGSDWGLSTGANNVTADADGRIKSWSVEEVSLTPTPRDPGTKGVSVVRTLEGPLWTDEASREQARWRFRRFGSAALRSLTSP